MSHGRSCAGPRTREVGKHLGEVAVSDGEGDTAPRNYRGVLRQGREPARLDNARSETSKPPLLLPTLKILLSNVLPNADVVDLAAYGGR